MAGKLNEGDVIEGIFCIALSLYIADGKVDKAKLNKIRTQVDTKMFNTGRFTYTVAEGVSKKRGNHPPDIFDVKFEMRLKPKSIGEAFGKDFHIHYTSSKDVGDLDKKIDHLINALQYGSFARRVKGAIDYFLDNNTSDRVLFTVISDGIEGETSGGDIKGDVTLAVHATLGSGVKKEIISGALPFSLKSESVTVSNLSPYYGMLDIAKALKIDWDGEEKYKRLSKVFKGVAEQNAKFELITAMYNDLKQRITAKSSSGTFTKDAFAFLSKNIFGSDLADVIDVTKGGVKEITKSYFDQLEKKTKLFVEENGNNLVFKNKVDQTPIFQIRTKLRPPPANEAKFYLEVGKGIYSK